MDQAQQESRYEIFSSTVMGFQFEEYRDWNPLLKQVIEKERKEGPGLERTNQGGWHSDRFLQRKEEPSIQALLRHVRKSLSVWAMATFNLETEPEVDGWDVELWGNINGKGHANRAHDHFRSGIVASGCYYLQTIEPQDEGRIVFVNQQSIPRFIESPLLPRQHSIALSPREGQCFIFPSWLGHRVEPHSSEAERISLAFNAGHPDLVVKRKGDRLVRQRVRQLLTRFRTARLSLP